MRACTACQNPLTVAQDDGEGRHRGQCPPQPDREAYLAKREATMPGLIQLHDHLRRVGQADAAAHKTIGQREDEG